MAEEKTTWKDLTPQQAEFLKYYLDPKSETWGNAYQTALRVGYTEEYATNITGQMPKWLGEALEDNNLVQQALSNLSEFIRDHENKNIQWDATKFTLSRLARNRFAERQEHTGADGKDLNIILSNAVASKHDTNQDTGTSGTG
jgi:phage terminase small subunit